MAGIRAAAVRMPVAIPEAPAGGDCAPRPPSTRSPSEAHVLRSREAALITTGDLAASLPRPGVLGSGSSWRELVAPVTATRLGVASAVSVRKAAGLEAEEVEQPRAVPAAEPGQAPKRWGPPALLL